MSKPILGFAGYSGSGKTTLLERMIPLFTAQGLRIAVIKHTHHDFEIDKAGTDSYRQRKAGASESLISSAQRWALIHELGAEPEASLGELLEQLSPCDLVLVEGYKHAAIPKLEIRRSALSYDYLYPGDPHIIAVVGDENESLPLPTLNINAPDKVVAFIMQQLQKGMI